MYGLIISSMLYVLATGIGLGNPGIDRGRTLIILGAIGIKGILEKIKR